MIIRSLLTLIISVWFNSFLLGQAADSAKNKRDNITSNVDIKDKQKLFGINSSTYLDSTFNYKVKIPTWLHLRNNEAQTTFGGTLPAVNGIENSILINGFSKSSFKSFDDFKEVYLIGNKFGQPTKYNKEFIWYGQNGIVELPNGVKERVFTFWRNKIYHNLFVLLETKSAYLWIQFTSTPETYDINIYKFEEFMSGFEIIAL